MSELARGDLLLRTAADGEAFVLARDKTYVALTAADLRWLCLAAGPAMLVEHAPLPKATPPPLPKEAPRE